MSGVKPLREILCTFELHGGYRQAIAQWSPFLDMCMSKEANWLDDNADTTPDGILDALLQEPNLRQAKRRLSLLVALCDLSGHWSLEQVTQALSRFADCAVRQTYEAAYATTCPNGPPANKSGFIVLAMGKLGAGELNYSSDIDLIFLYDTDRYTPAEIPRVSKQFLRLGREMIALLSDITQEGYVFRTDLDLRPNPSSTPICVSTASARQYYESYGRTWERAAFIKARVCPVGDQEAGEAFLTYLRPFTWRKHLDYAAIDDAYSMINRIRKQQKTGRPEINLKLDRGGIREIEFFAQTCQLIRGGRHSELRTRGTCETLRGLCKHGFIEVNDTETLIEAYTFLRTVEHRVQMINDAQTHNVRDDLAHQTTLAQMCGLPDIAAFQDKLAGVRASVRTITEALYVAPAQTDSTEDLIERYPDPDAVRQSVDSWLSGQVSATRSTRARETLKRLLPMLLDKFLATSHAPEQALAQFDMLIGRLPSGVQVFSLLEAEPALLETVVHICTYAPDFLDQLARYPSLFDLLLSVKSHDNAFDFTQDLQHAVARAASYEKALDAMRRWAREHRFAVSLKTVLHILSPQQAGVAFSHIAQACVQVAYDLVSQDADYPLCVLALGRLGSQEMTVSSDLDLIVIYDGGSVDPKQAGRWTRRFVSALTVQTAEGALYEVDMRLRPSGRAGPVAVSAQAFTQYHQEAAWTWEHLALTRARCLCGDAGVTQAVDATIRAVVQAPHDAQTVVADTHEMFEKLQADDLNWKTQTGGLTMLEFCVQACCLLHGIKRPSFAETLEALIAQEAIPAVLADIWRDYQGYLQTVRILNGHTLAPDRLPAEQQRHLLQADMVGHTQTVTAFYKSLSP